MKLFPIAAIAAAVAVATPALADDFVISTGAKGGTYHNVFGVNLAQVMREHGIKATVSDSKGSVDNLERIASGEASVGFTQADALAHWLKGNPGARIEILGSLGEECVYIASSKKGSIDDESDLANEGVKIAVGEQGTGSAVTWDYLRTLEDDYQAASTYYQGGVMSLAKVKTGQLDAFLWVTSPDNLNHKFLEVVNAKGSELRVIDVNDWDLNDELPNGERVYEFKDVDVESGFMAKSVEVPCTDVMVVGSADMDGDHMEAVATAVMMNANRLMGK